MVEASCGLDRARGVTLFRHLTSHGQFAISSVNALPHFDPRLEPL